LKNSVLSVSTRCVGTSILDAFASLAAGAADGAFRRRTPERELNGPEDFEGREQNMGEYCQEKFNVIEN
jgi:hypothetical protein